MRFRGWVATSFAVGAAAVGFAGCGIPSASNSDFVRGSAGNDAGGRAGNTARAGSAGVSSGGKAGTNTGGKGGAVTGSPCKAVGECDDGNDCTTDSCLPSGCSYSPLLPGSSCDTNRDKCDGVGKCSGSTCVIDPATAIDFVDDDKCTNDLCDPITGKVSNPLKVKESDSTLCTKAFCDPATGTAKTVDLAADGDPCTIDECDFSVGPINTPVAAGDGNPCTADSCAGGTEGKPLLVHKPIDKCTGCKTSDSLAEQAKVCDDGNPCTVDTCVDGPSGPTCQTTEVGNNTVIDIDGTRCNGTLTCVGGKAVNLNVKQVDDGLACTDDSCNPATGDVLHDERQNCINCKVVADCPQVDEACQSYECDKGICVRQFATGPTCSDDKACTTGDRCAFGECRGFRNDNPSDNDACTINDECKEPDGRIEGTDIGNGCISCMGADISPCGDQTAPDLDAECVIPKCLSGKCGRELEPPTKLCGAMPANACEDQGYCKSGKCTGPVPKTACCLDKSECGTPATCTQDFSCVNNKCVAGAAVVCDPDACDDTQKQKYIDYTCSGTAPGSCQPVAKTCNSKVCEGGVCVVCSPGKDERCNSRFCGKWGANDKKCCPGTIKPCEGEQECRESDGCPRCDCDDGRSCGPAIASGAAGAGGAAPTNHTCK